LAPFFFGKQLSDNYFWTFSASEHAFAASKRNKFEKKCLLRDTNKRPELPYVIRIKNRNDSFLLFILMLLFLFCDLSINKDLGFFNFK
jgi:hypothetical protein